jgi:hypothetical protein
MTEKRVRRLLVKLPTDLCVSYLVDSHGEIQFRKPTPSGALGLAAGLALSLAACTRKGGEPVPPPPVPAASTTALPTASAAAPVPVDSLPLSPVEPTVVAHKLAAKPPLIRLGGAPQITSRRRGKDYGY